MRQSHKNQQQIAKEIFGIDNDDVVVMQVRELLKDRRIFYIAPEEYKTIETTDGEKLTDLFPRGIWAKFDERDHITELSNKGFL